MLWRQLKWTHQFTRLVSRCYSSCFLLLLCCTRWPVVDERLIVLSRDRSMPMDISVAITRSVYCRWRLLYCFCRLPAEHAVIYCLIGRSSCRRTSLFAVDRTILSRGLLLLDCCCCCDRSIDHFFILFHLLALLLLRTSVLTLSLGCSLVEFIALSIHDRNRYNFLSLVDIHTDYTVLIVDHHGRCSFHNSFSVIANSSVLWRCLLNFHLPHFQLTFLLYHWRTTTRFLSQPKDNFFKMLDELSFINTKATWSKYWTLKLSRF